MIILVAPQAVTPQELTAHLRTAPLLHAAFTQTRTLQALSRPLVSRGRMVVDQARGVLWEVKTPFPAVFVVTPQGVQERNREGAPKAQAPSPPLAQMGRILKGLLEGRWEALDPYFSLQASGTPERWELRLLPKPQAASFLKGGTLQGGRTLDRIQLVEPSGDRTEIVFTQSRTDLPLTDQERQLLEGK